jgi:iron-sulfur cluster insertion protein
MTAPHTPSPGAKTMTEAVTPDSAILLTDSAVAKVAELIASEGNPALKLRIYVSGGGCSGLMYNFAFDEKVEEDDTIVQKDHITLLIDAMSFQYMAGAEVDFEEGLEGARFLIRNPNASSTCGCGSSFTA